MCIEPQTYFLTGRYEPRRWGAVCRVRPIVGVFPCGLLGKFERTLDNLDFLPVVGVEISVEQFLKFIFDKLLFVGVLLIGRFHSSKSKKNKDKTSREQMQILFEN